MGSGCGRGACGLWRDGQPGTGMVELSLLLPFLLFSLLAAVDFSRALDTQRNLARAAHLATLRLIKTPQLDVQSYMSAATRISGINATTSYTSTVDGSDQVVVQASYPLPLLLPGIESLSAGPLQDGQLMIGVQAAGIAATNAPTLTTSGSSPLVLTAQAPADNTTPPGVSLVCTIRSATTVQSGACPLSWTSPHTGTYTATVVQANGVSSPPTTLTL